MFACFTSSLRDASMSPHVSGSPLYIPHRHRRGSPTMMCGFCGVDAEPGAGANPAEPSGLPWASGLFISCQRVAQLIVLAQTTRLGFPAFPARLRSSASLLRGSRFGLACPGLAAEPSERLSSLVHRGEGRMSTMGLTVVILPRRKPRGVLMPACPR